MGERKGWIKCPKLLNVIYGRAFGNDDNSSVIDNFLWKFVKTVNMNTVKLGHKKLGYNKLGYNELGNNEIRL